MGRPLNIYVVDDSAVQTDIAKALLEKAGHAVTADYGGPAVARQQTAAYPDIEPLHLAMPAPQAFGLALGAAKAMPGWHILATDPHQPLHRQHAPAAQGGIN